MSFETMYPHIRGTPKKIIAVTFEDGATIKVDENDIRGYLKTLDARRIDQSWRDIGFDQSTRRWMETIWKVEAALQARKNASKPRKKKTITPAAIQKYKTEYEAKYKKSWGWIKSAAAGVS